MADRRNTLIAIFREYKGLHYMPSNLHVALRWNERDPYLEYNDREYISWQIMEPVRRNKPSQCYTERDGSKGTHALKKVVLPTMGKRRN